MKIDSFRNEFFFLSNFYPIEIEIDGKKYKSAEHYYQACKALDPIEHELIRNAETAAMTKKYVRKIKSFNDDWNNIRLDVMCKALKAKFSIPEMRNALLLTDGYELEESNWWGDTYWGTYNGVGHNNLGKLLMKFRETIKNEHKNLI